MSRKNIVEKQQLIAKCYELALKFSELGTRSALNNEGRLNEIDRVAEIDQVAMIYLDKIIKSADVWYSEESRGRNENIT